MAHTQVYLLRVIFHLNAGKQVETTSMCYVVISTLVLSSHYLLLPKFDQFLPLKNCQYLMTKYNLPVNWPYFSAVFC